VTAESHDLDEAVREAEEARLLRARRDAALTACAGARAVPAAFDDPPGHEARALMLPDLAGLIGARRGADVRFVAIGGIAVAAHQVVRATEDLDAAYAP
jgi:hypothetical protein